LKAKKLKAHIYSMSLSVICIVIKENIIWLCFLDYYSLAFHSPHKITFKKITEIQTVVNGRMSAPDISSIDRARLFSIEFFVDHSDLF
jgi:hypothetical protein